MNNKKTEAIKGPVSAHERSIMKWWKTVPFDGRMRLIDTAAAVGHRNPGILEAWGMMKVLRNLPTVWRRADLAEAIRTEEGGPAHEAYAKASKLILSWGAAGIIEKAGKHTLWRFKK